MEFHISVGPTFVLVAATVVDGHLRGDRTWTLREGDQLWGWEYEDFRKMGTGKHFLKVPKPERVPTEEN